MPILYKNGIPTGGFIDRLINAWGFILDRYESMVRYDEAGLEEDVGYRLGERSNVGHLAAAAFLAGGASVEEYGVEKKKTNKDKSDWGKIDLLIQSSDPKDRFIIEAKDFHFAVDSKTVQGSINALIDECKKVLDYIECGSRMGIIFAVPHSEKEISEELLNNFWESIKAMPDWKYLAFYQRINVEKKLGERGYWPGVFLGFINIA